jgi:hypothetical protein
LNILYHTENATPENFSYTQTCNGSLPIELGSFNVTCGTNERLGLFSTVSEHNASYFIVQSSEDMMFWNNVQTIIASGNSNTQRDYTWIDQINYGPNTVYYQLLQFDNDGQYHTYGLYQSTCDFTSNIINIYPNPSHENTDIYITGSISNIKIYNIVGAEVNYEMIDNYIVKGLAKGIYLFVINDSYTFRVIVD